MMPFLDEWISEKTEEPLDRAKLELYQIERVRAVAKRARHESPFYSERLSAMPEGFPASFDDFATVQPTTSDDLTRNPTSFMALPQDEIARIVTLRTSGTAGECKRLFFAEEDLAATIEIFRVGMATFVRQGGRALVLLPGERPGSIGDLLIRAVAPERQCILHSPSDGRTALEHAVDAGAECLVGMPAQVLSLARGLDSHLGRSLSQVLLCADYAAPSLVSGIEQAWGCIVRRHYGLTETLYGGALECTERDGLHLMEGNYLFEILDPRTLAPAPEGEFGEILLTTLCATGTPLLRYRTGDRGRFLPGTCRCGSILRRVEITGRIGNGIALNEDVFLPMHELDEAMFSIPWLGDYAVSSDGGLLNFELYAPARAGRSPELTEEELSDLADALNRLPPSAKATLEREAPSFRFRMQQHAGVTSVKRMAR